MEAQIKAEKNQILAQVIFKFISLRIIYNIYDRFRVF